MIVKYKSFDRENNAPVIGIVTSVEKVEFKSKYSNLHNEFITAYDAKGHAYSINTVRLISIEDDTCTSFVDLGTADN